MTVRIGQPPNISILNQRKVAYLKGSELVDGSIRFAIDDDTDIPTIEERISGLWQPSPFKVSPESLHIGLGLALSKAGHHLLADDGAGHYHFYSHNIFDGELSTGDARILNAYDYEEEEIIQSDESGYITSSSFTFTFPATAHELISKAYFKTGAGATNEPVRIRVYTGTDDTGALIFDQTYPASDFSINSTIELATEGFVELELGDNYFFKIESDDALSIKTNAAQTLPYLAVDRSLIREDDMLQTTEWVDGETFEIGQLSIQDRQIYQCNTDGVQETSFAANPEKWNVMSPSIYSWEVVEDNTAIIIPENHQMSVHGTFTLEGDLILEGTLVMRN